MKPELPLIGNPQSDTESAQAVIEQLGAAFFAFVQADTWEESRKVLEQHPELLDPELGPVLRAFIDSYTAELQAGDETGRLAGVVEQLQRHLVLLERCRTDGWETAIDRMNGERMLEEAQTLVPPFNEFAIGGTLDKMKSIVLGHVELLAQSANDQLEGYVRFVSNQDESFGLLCGESLALLQRCQQEGTDRAFANERIRSFATPDGLVFGPYAQWLQAQAASGS